MEKSKFISLDTKDAIRGVVMAVIGSVLTALVEILQIGAFPSRAQWKIIIIGGLATGAAYILKNLFTNSQDQLFKKETIDASSDK